MKIIMLFRTFVVFLWVVASLIFLLPAMFYFKFKKANMRPEIFDKQVHMVASIWASGIIFFSGVRVHVQGAENIPDDKAVLFVSNHQSNFDFLLFLSKIKKEKGFIAKIETAKIPLIRTWMIYLKCIFLDRSDIRQTAKTILEGIEILKNGHSMSLFPEGTRSKSDNIGEFKAGSFKLATKAKVPIIPVTLNKVYKVLEANKNLINASDVYITIHEPIPTARLSAEEERTLCDRVKNIIEKSIVKG